MKRTKYGTFFSVVAALSFGLVSFTLAGGKEGVHWGYEGKMAPTHWGDLASEFKMCKLGKSQSPIDVAQTTAASLDPIRTNYRPVPLHVVNNGHTIQVNYEKGSTMKIGGNEYELLQFHFHSPSEHTINGKAAEMEVHLVHKNKAGQLAVIGVLIEKGKERAPIQMVWKHLPTRTGEEKRVPQTMINAKDLLPEDLSYFNYSGSLTTPPCSEGVNWILLKTPITLSGEQIQAFSTLFPGSVRPVQPMHGRTVKASK